MQTWEHRAFVLPVMIGGLLFAGCSGSESISIQVAAPFSTSISSGSDHTCLLYFTGQVKCWGRGTKGRLGYGNTTSLGGTSANDIVNAGNVNLPGKTVQITTGSEHTCALLENGNVYCWGESSSVQLGYGDTDDVGAATVSDIVNKGTINISARNPLRLRFLFFLNLE